MYRVVQRLGYSHCDSKGRVTLFSIMNMLQDIGGYFSEDNGLGEVYLHENDLGWIVYNWNIEIIKEATIYETGSLEIMTLVYEHKGAICNRYYEIRNQKSELLIKAYATWVLIRYSTGHPIRLTDKIIQEVRNDKEGLDIRYKIEKPLMPSPLPLENEFQEKVALSYIDIRGHMNNARYLEILQEELEEYHINKIYINYQIPLFYEEKFVIKKYKSDKNLYFDFQVQRSGKEEVSACLMSFECNE